MNLSIRKIAVASLLLIMASPAFAGTQDFTLYNQTGVLIYELYISESKNNRWEEDVLGNQVLDHGEYLNVTFSGRSACWWDIMAVDSDGNNVYWEGIDLCSTYTVTLTCDSAGDCWATSN